MIQIWFACAPGSIQAVHVRDRSVVYMVDEKTVSVDSDGRRRVRVGTLSRMQVTDRNDLVLVDMEPSMVVVDQNRHARLACAPDPDGPIHKANCARVFRGGRCSCGALRSLDAPDPDRCARPGCGLVFRRHHMDLERDGHDFEPIRLLTDEQDAAPPPMPAMMAEKGSAAPSVAHPLPWRWERSAYPSMEGHGGVDHHPHALILVDAKGEEVIGAHGDDWAWVECASPYVRAVTERAGAMEALLRQVEWSATGVNQFTDRLWKCCPVCDGVATDIRGKDAPAQFERGHGADCSLRALLAEIDAAKGEG